MARTNKQLTAAFKAKRKLTPLDHLLANDLEFHVREAALHQDQVAYHTRELKRLSKIATTEREWPEKLLALFTGGK